MSLNPYSQYKWTFTCSVLMVERDTHERVVSLHPNSLNFGKSGKSTNFINNIIDELIHMLDIPQEINKDCF